MSPDTTAATVCNREIPLRNTNVVLVDGADTDLPAVVGTWWIDPRYVGADPVVAAVTFS
jgi:hypothetical protein